MKDGDLANCCMFGKLILVLQSKLRPLKDANKKNVNF